MPGWWVTRTCSRGVQVAQRRRSGSRSPSEYFRLPAQVPAAAAAATTHPLPPLHTHPLSSPGTMLIICATMRGCMAGDGDAETRGGGRGGGGSRRGAGNAWQARAAACTLRHLARRQAGPHPASGSLLPVKGPSNAADAHLWQLALAGQVARRRHGVGEPSGKGAGDLAQGSVGHTLGTGTASDGGGCASPAWPHPHRTNSQTSHRSRAAARKRGLTSTRSSGGQ